RATLSRRSAIVRVPTRSTRSRTRTPSSRTRSTRAPTPVTTCCSCWACQRGSSGGARGGPMSKALMRQSGGGSGVVTAVCSAIIPGVGQLVNGQTDKAVGVFAVGVFAVAVAASLLHGVPIIGGIAALVGFGTWLYGIGDAYVTGKRGKR